MSLKTESKQVAQQYRVQDNQPLTFLKDENLRRYYEINGKRINLYTKVGNEFYLPRGAYENNTFPLKINMALVEHLSLRDYQEEAILAILTTNKMGGMIRSGESTGKTRMMLGTRQASQLPCVIVVPTKTIQRGIKKEFKEFGANIIEVSGSNAEIDPNESYVICAKTMSLIFDKLNDGKRIMIIDECHHASSIVIGCMNRRDSYVFGFTASPIRKEFGEEGFKILYGKIHETGQEGLPIKVFGIRKLRQYTLKYAMECAEGLPPESYEIYRRILNQDPVRRKEIIELAVSAYKKNKRVIVFCDRIGNSAQVLYDAIKEIIPNSFLLIGKTSHQNIQLQVANLEEFIIVASTGCACEGLDIPSLQCGILTFNTSFIKTIRQMAGRMRRRFKDKEHGVFIDIMDVVKIGTSKPYYGGISKRKRYYDMLGFTFKQT